MHIRTDLAEEQAARQSFLPKGASLSNMEWEGAAVSLVSIQDQEAEHILGKPVGEYYTIRCESFCQRSSEKGGKAAAKVLRQLLPQKGTVLAVGLGNAHVTPDSLGPEFAKLLPPTRLVDPEKLHAAGFSDCLPCAVVAPGVAGQTGMDSAEIVLALVRKINPAAVIAVDALAAGEASRLGTTIQICNTGISPGSGVANCRPELSSRTLGIPVIAVGVPTVVDFPMGKASLMVTPREVDAMIQNAAKTLAEAVLQALQPEDSCEILM